jgi:hypothetical protein
MGPPYVFYSFHAEPINSAGALIMGEQFLEYVEPVVQYVESQLERTASAMRSGEGDVLGLLSGNGTSQVDVVFYMILHSMFNPYQVSVNGGNR